MGWGAKTQETVALPGLGPTVLYMFLPPKSRITGRYHMVWPVAGFVIYIVNQNILNSLLLKIT